MCARIFKEEVLKSSLGKLLKKSRKKIKGVSEETSSIIPVDIFESTLE